MTMTLTLALPVLLWSLQAAQPSAGQEYVRTVEEWRAKHEADYRRDYVPLAGLFLLSPGANTVGSAPGSTVRLPDRAPASVGRFILDGGIVRFEPAPGVGVRLREEPVTGPVEVRPDGQVQPRDELRLGDLAFWVHRSGKRTAIRLRDPRGEPARTFAGFRWYPIDPAYRVPARFIRDPKPREIRMVTLDGDEQVYTSEGVVEFRLRGRTVRMRPMTTRPGRLFFVFRDATSGRETYGAARFLYADLQPDGRVVMDFNQAYNPPCAFNPFTTCPLPIRENRLTIPIAAGELDYKKP